MSTYVKCKTVKKTIYYIKHTDNITVYINKTRHILSNTEYRNIYNTEKKLLNVPNGCFSCKKDLFPQLYFQIFISTPNGHFLRKKDALICLLKRHKTTPCVPEILEK
jgi:hypothetical protein